MGIRDDCTRLVNHLPANGGSILCLRKSDLSDHEKGG
jgi:hypothetical protein